MSADVATVATTPTLLNALRPFVAMSHSEAMEMERHGRRFVYCQNDVLNPCWDPTYSPTGWGTEHGPGKHWGGGDACPECKLRAAIADAQRAPTPFEHEPRPPVVNDAFPDQRHFCRPGGERGLYGVEGGGELFPGSSVDFYRHSKYNHVRLSVSVHQGAAFAGAHLDAAGLREVARLCLDAAHDLEQFRAPVVGS